MEVVTLAKKPGDMENEAVVDMLVDKLVDTLVELQPETFDKNSEGCGDGGTG